MVRSLNLATQPTSITLAVLLYLVFSPGQQLSATVLTFADATTYSGSFDFGVLDRAFTFDRTDLIQSDGTYFVAGDGKYLGSGGGFGSVFINMILTQPSSATFSIDSFDLGPLFVPGSAGNKQGISNANIVDMYGYRKDKTILHTTLVPSQTADIHLAGWNDFVSVWWFGSYVGFYKAEGDQIDIPAAFAIDNLTVNEQAVPEPPSWAYTPLTVCSALGLLLGRRWMRKGKSCSGRTSANAITCNCQ